MRMSACAYNNNWPKSLIYIIKKKITYDNRTNNKESSIRTMEAIVQTN